MHSNGRNRLPAAGGPSLAIFSPRTISGLELLDMLDVARRRAFEVARRIDCLCQLRAMEPAARAVLDELVRRALAFEEAAAGLIVAIEDPPRANNRAGL